MLAYPRDLEIIKPEQLHRAVNVKCRHFANCITRAAAASNKDLRWNELCTREVPTEYELVDCRRNKKNVV